MSATCSVETAAEQLGIGRGTAYRQIARTGTLAGLPVLRIGRRIVVPTAPLEHLLTYGTLP